LVTRSPSVSVLTGAAVVDAGCVGFSWAVGVALAAQPARSRLAKARKAGAVYREVIMGSLY
jgi:hypothetical protein